jgi:hypothetical protein
LVAALVLLLVALLSPAARAADFSVTHEVGATKLGVEDQIEYTVTVSGSVGNIPMPSLTNLQVVSGPNVTSHVSLVPGGGMSQSRSYTFVLQPQAPGHAEIGPVRASAGGVEKIAAAITLEVVAGSVRPKQQAPPPDPFDPFQDPLEALMRRRGRGRAAAPAPKLFIEGVVSRNRVYVGEPVLITYYVYTQAGITDLRLKEAPSYAGLWAEDLPSPARVPGGEPVTVDGEHFQRSPIVQRLLFPTKAGTVTISPLTVLIGLQAASFFDAGGTVERSSKPVTLTATALPDEPGFSGAVGRFSVNAKLDRDVVGLGEAVTLRFEVKGNGNLKWVDRAPDLQVPGAKVYPPQVKSELTATPDGITGSKTWEYIVVPETGGTLEVPPLRFSYFDPAAGQLTHANTAPLQLQVAGTAAPSAGIASAAAAIGAGGPLALRSELDPPRRGLPESSARVLLAALALALLAHGGLFAGAWWRDRARATAGRPRVGDARRALADLKRASGNGLSKESACALIEQALHDVFGALEENGAPLSERERAARAVLQEAHVSRYAPQLGDYSEKIQEVARHASEVVRRWA